MAGQSNGAGAPIGYMLPGASNEYALPPAPGEPAHGWEAPPVADPLEHQTSVDSSSIPDSENYVGGGIFAAETLGPADQGLPDDSLHAAPSRGASNFGPTPNVPLQAPMSGMGMQQVPMQMPMSGMQQGPMMSPMGKMPNERAHLLGASVIAMAAGVTVGFKYGGIYGGVAGSLIGGAVVNAYRAFSYYKDGTEEADKEAKISGTYAVLSTAAAAALWMKMVPDSYKGQMTPNKKKRMKKNDNNDYSQYESNDDSCAIRPVGP